MTDKYQGQRVAPFLATPMKLLDNKEYLKWLGTTECKIWHIMVRYIIRAPMRQGFGKKIYKNYYKNGKLAMSLKLEKIAKKAYLNSIGHVSEHIQSMVKKGFIIKHKDKWLGRSIIVYELGFHDGNVNKWETLHMQTEIARREAKKNIAGFRLRETADSL